MQPQHACVHEKARLQGSVSSQPEEVEECGPDPVPAPSGEGPASHQLSEEGEEWSSYTSQEDASSSSMEEMVNGLNPDEAAAVQILISPPPRMLRCT